LVLAETLLLLYLQNLLEKPLKSLAFIQQLSMLPGAKKM
jgi:DNA repair protein RecO (recombination protein O)